MPIIETHPHLELFIVPAPRGMLGLKNNTIALANGDNSVIEPLNTDSQLNIKTLVQADLSGFIGGEN